MSRYGVLKVCISHPIPVPRVREPAQFGGHSAGVTPLPIPNREVKPCSADGTWGASPWESRSPPVFLRKARESGPFVVLGGVELELRIEPAEGADPLLDRRMRVEEACEAV